MYCCSQGGWVVCEEDKDRVLAAWEEDVKDQRRKEAAVSVHIITYLSMSVVVNAA